MKHLDLFSGIGGFALAASWVWGAEHEIVSFCEIEPLCQKVLKKHWPDVPIISDIRDIKGEDYAGTVDIITGGFPCQPFSCAGKQKGKDDDRYLWPEMLRVIQGFNPSWIIGENVAGIVNMGLDQMLSDLENSGFEVQPFIIPACGVDAPHRRDRVWIVAHSISKRPQGYAGDVANRICADVADAKGQQGSSSYNKTKQKKTGDKEQVEFRRRNRRALRGCCWLPEPKLGRVANGIPDRVDRLKGLGNAIVPQVVVPIMEAIRQLDKESTE